eukprot:TRINITY_DN15486_c0_g1_i1.p1 TRINITY_DN15486_c0_g1~~TRINITY_DN15486_c0_g1_i1.p1  ORF type:complete len:413 (+),score=83.62 TRINITY_DN15486_c0_g1_i1:185-1240(+)
MDTTALLKGAEEARNTLGDKFGSALRESLHFGGEFIPRPSVTHYLLASLPMHNVVTTNFDPLLEHALKYLKKAAFTISSPAHVARAPMGTHHTNVLKIHGDLSTPNEVVLTESDYDRYFEHRPAVATLLRGLLLNRTFVFIGYSLRDPNLNIIIDEVSSLLKDARRPCYAIVFDATDDEVILWKAKGIYLLRLQGENSFQKTIALWEFLDSLQTKYYAPHGAWLAPDSEDFLPKDTPKKQVELLDTLKSTLTSLADEIIKSKDYVKPEMVDFIMPFLSLGAKHGMTLDPIIWETVSKHYKKREPHVESELILSMAATIEALEQACGKGEQKYLDEIDKIEKKMYSLQDSST